MTCEEARDLVSGFLDGELDLRTQSEIDRHVRDCSGCSRELENQRTLHGAIASAELRRSAPAGLRSRVRAAVAADLLPSRPTPARGWHFAWGWLGTGAALASAIILTVNFALRGRPDHADLVSQEVVSAHIRSLMPTHLTDVLSSDQHTVKPWFNGRLDFSPPVTDLKEAGFPLTGGRVDALSGHPVAALVYQRRLHVINLFIWPTGGRSDLADESFSQRGYNVITWNQRSWNFCAVSDLNPAELRQFVNSIQAAVQPSIRE